MNPIQFHLMINQIPLLGIFFDSMMLGVGILAIGTLIVYFSPTIMRLRGRAVWVTYIGALVVSGGIGWAATTGGHIRHSDAQGQPAPGTIDAVALRSPSKNDPCASGMFAIMAWQCLTSGQNDMKR